MPIGVVIGLCSALLTAVVTEVYCHRCLAHRAFRIRPGYNNSHHAHPSAARIRSLDPIWPLLRLTAAVGLIELDGPRPLAPSSSSAVCCDALASLVGAP